MKTITMQVLAALTAATLSTGVHAAGKGGTNPNAGGAAGQGGAHMSASGQANTNSGYAEERQFGEDRAAARRSEQGNAHKKAAGTPPAPKGAAVPATEVGGSPSKVKPE